MYLGNRPQEVELDAIEKLFDALTEVAFFVKDREGRYVAVNHTLARRCGMRSKSEILGKTVMDVHPRPLAAAYEAQDRQVIDLGATIEKHLELHMYPNRRRGWCLTHKTPLRNEQGDIVGLVGTSHDLGLVDEQHPVYRQVARIAQHIRENYDQQLNLNELARDEGLSLARVERLFQKVFHYSPRQLLLQSRLEGALSLIEAHPGRSIADIARECGYTDHSAFSRQFKAMTGYTPSQFRNGSRPSPVAFSPVACAVPAP
ncbi:AraC family transcriptional regulator [Pseudoduganella violaceinigra]|uniref:AraC family transcriptional regulator n=1 Tax=Pseudoduganella violaceinigra TaxID=246602 RepID=UPI000683E515|nr:AraC family transcriptional regulator [Pseudoduganella violaceinigra]